MSQRDLIKRRAYDKRRYADPETRERRLTANRIYRKKRRHDFMLREKFGITSKEYENLLNTQNGVCAICLQPEQTLRQGKVLKLSVDHSHTSGKIRGLLCGHCNRGLGSFKDNPEALRRASDYLLK